LDRKINKVLAFADEGAIGAEDVETNGVGGIGEGGRGDEVGGEIERDARGNGEWVFGGQPVNSVGESCVE